MSPTPGRSTLITSAPNQASNCVQVGPDCTWVKSRMRTPFSALVICLAPLISIYSRHARECGHPVITVDSIGHSLHLSIGRRLLVSRFREDDAGGLFVYFFFSLLCGLRLPMRPLSLPAPGSSTALIKVGLPESIAALTARRSSSGEVALTPTPPNASIILS